MPFLKSPPSSKVELIGSVVNLLGRGPVKGLKTFVVTDSEVVFMQVSYFIINSYLL